MSIFTLAEITITGDNIQNIVGIITVGFIYWTSFRK